MHSAADSAETTARSIRTAGDAGRAGSQPAGAGPREVDDEKGRSPAPGFGDADKKKELLSPLLLLLRCAKDDAAACDRKQIELQGQALADLVFPCRADAVPELLFPRSKTCQAISAGGVVSRCGAFFGLFLPYAIVSLLQFRADPMPAVPFRGRGA